MCTKMLLKTTKKKNLRDQKIIFLKGISKKQIRKMIKELFFLFRCQNKFRNFFREGFKQVLCQKKKEVAFILFESTRLKKNTQEKE